MMMLAMSSPSRSARRPRRSSRPEAMALVAKLEPVALLGFVSGARSQPWRLTSAFRLLPRTG
jgi:hypothetical protein